MRPWLEKDEICEGREQDSFIGQSVSRYVSGTYAPLQTNVSGKPRVQSAVKTSNSCKKSHILVDVKTFLERRPGGIPP
jgi:hypothetical protein